ncbi:MAG: DUF4184 family protein [Chitinophagales bacterium]
MPFTLAHIGYTIPIAKKLRNYCSISGLVFGSIAPDYDILFRFTANRFHLFSYSILCNVFIIMPLAILSTLFFHLVCQSIIIQKTPNIKQEFWSRLIHTDILDEIVNRPIRLIFSILLSIYVHLLLDSMCHILDAYTIKMLVIGFTKNDSLAKVAYILAIYFLPLLFSIVGLLYLLYSGNLIQSIKEIYQEKKMFNFWIIVFVFAVIITVVKVMLIQTEYFFAFDYYIISLTSSFLISLSLCCLYYKLSEKKKIT